jgi:hypothetical protein
VPSAEKVNRASRALASTTIPKRSGLCGLGFRYPTNDSLDDTGADARLLPILRMPCPTPTARSRSDSQPPAI